MRLSGLTGSDAEATTIGSYFLDLDADSSWVSRRGETIHILDDHRLERRITLDLDLDDLRSRARNRLKLSQDPSTLLVPLTFLEKSLFLDFDLSGPDGNSLHLVTSDQDSRAAQCMMLAHLLEDRPQTISQKLRDKLYDVAAHFPGDALGVSADAYTVRQIHPTSLAGFPDADRDQWVTWLRRPGFIRLLTTFTTHYMPIAALPVPADQSAAMVKMRLVDPWDHPGENALLGLGPAGFNIKAPTIGRYRREHIRVLAPEGTELSGIGLVSAEASAPEEPGAVLVGASDFYARLTPERGVVYAKGHNRNDESVELSFTMWPMSRDFLRPALFTTLASALLLGGGAAGEFTKHFLSQRLEGNLDAAIALLLVVPSLYSIYLSRAGEHALRSRLLRRQRYWVFGAAIAHGIAVTSLLAISVMPDKFLAWAWTAGAVYCALAFVYNASYGMLKLRSMSPVLDQMDRTSGPKSILRA